MEVSTNSGDSAGFGGASELGRGAASGDGAAVGGSERAAADTATPGEGAGCGGTLLGGAGGGEEVLPATTTAADTRTGEFLSGLGTAEEGVGALDVG